MNDWKRSHTIYIQSKYRDTGTTSSYTIALPDLINNDAMMEKFKVSLQDFTVYNKWYLVSDYRGNTLTIDNNHIVIPDGTYTFVELIDTIDTAITAYGGDAVYDTVKNKMTMSFASSKTVVFDDIGKILGFTPYTAYTGTLITSGTPLTPYPQTHIYIRLTNISPLNDHLTFSNHSGEVRASDILAKVLINASPFQLITYQQILETDGLYTNENSLNKLELVITDSDGNEIQDFPEHDFTLKIESLPIEDVDLIDIKESLQDIKATLQDMFLQKHLKHRGGFQL